MRTRRNTLKTSNKVRNQILITFLLGLTMLVAFGVIMLQSSFGDINFLMEPLAKNQGIGPAGVAQITGSLEGIARSAFLFLCFGIILYSALMFYLIYSIFPGLKRIGQAIGFMNKGDFKHKLDLPLNNELGDIARALDLAMEHISTSQQLLINEKAGVEKVVDQRTSELSEEKARFLASINSLPLGYILLDRQGNILLLNPKVRHILKLNPTIEHEVAQNNEGGEGNKIIDSVINNVQKMAAHQKHLDTQDITSANGRFLHVLASAIMDGNTIEGFVVLVEDVTEAKILERSRDEFFSIASHELRTPLTAIRGNASMIKDFYKEQLKTEGLDEMVNDIHTSSVRLLEIVNDFLDTSSLELGKMRFEPKDISIDKIIEDVVYEMGSISKQKKVHIVAGTVLGKLPPVFADPNRIKQVILNLVGNALKFTTEGSVTIIAEAQLKGMVKVSIVDTGRGISPEGQQLLFHKFQQAGKSLFTRDAAGGTGLGLYISKLIVEKQGGKISLERSEEGVGSTFSFTLPIAKVNSSSELADNETKLVAEAVATSSI